VGEGPVTGGGGTRLEETSVRWGCREREGYPERAKWVDKKGVKSKSMCGNNVAGGRVGGGE